MKCSDCKQDKPTSAFAVCCSRKRGRQRQCKECRASYDRVRYAKKDKAEKTRLRKKAVTARERNRKFIADYLCEHPCGRCGFSDIRALDFHHVAEKLSTVSRMATSCCSLDTLQSEIAKCQVLCANCHRIVTAEARTGA